VKVRTAKLKMAGCSRCHTLLKIRYGTTLLLHLREEHDIDGKQSAIILKEVFTAMHVKIQEQKRVHQEAQ